MSATGKERTMRGEVQTERCIGVVPDNEYERAVMQEIIAVANYSPGSPIYWGDITINGEAMVGMKINLHSDTPDYIREAEGIIARGEPQGLEETDD